MQGKFMTFISESYSELKPSPLSSMFFICRVAGLRESQSQALNLNLLREKL